MAADHDPGLSRIGPVAIDDVEDVVVRRKHAPTEQRVASYIARRLLFYVGIAGGGAGVGAGGVALLSPSETPAGQPPVTVVAESPDPVVDAARQCECVCKSTAEVRRLLDYAQAFADHLELPEDQRPRPGPPPPR